MSEMEMELPLIEDEVEEEQPEEELLRYLDDAVDEDEEAKTEREKKEEEDRLQAVVDRKIAERFTRPLEQDERPTRRVEREEEPTPSPQSVDDVFDKLADDIVNDMAADPKSAVKKLLQITRTTTENAGLKAIARANRLAIEHYRNEHREDPLFKAVQKDFDDKVDSYTDAQLGNATPKQIRDALDTVRKAAIGEYYENQLKNRSKKAAEPPNYSGGSSSGRAAAGVSRVLTREDKQLIKMGKSAGLSDKDIREMLRDERGKR